MHKASLKEVQDIGLQMLKVFDEFCRMNNIKYSLFCGTLLGAIRHKGFIPWDDDIDLAMLRSEYEKLISLNDYSFLEKNGLTLFSHELCNEYLYPFAKLSHNSTAQTEQGTIVNKNVKLGISIDIFPLDPLGNSFDDAKKDRKKVCRYVSYICYKFFNPPKRDFSLINFLKTIRRKFLQLVPYCYYENRINSIIKKYNISNSKYIALLVWASSYKTIAEKKWFDELVSAEFENFHFPVFKCYDNILKVLYNDYMVLPPMDKRKPMHLGEIYID